MGKGEHEEPHNADHGGTIPSPFHTKKSPEFSASKVSPATERPPTAADLDHKQALERQKKRREREPLLYCKLVTKYPLWSFLLALSGHILMFIISIGLVISGYDLLPVDFENLPLEINDQPYRPRDVAWEYRNSFQGYYDRTPTTGYRVYSYPRASVDLYYDGDGDNVFTKEKLKAIEAIENELISIPKYQSTYCQLDSTMSACEKPTSILRYFDGTYASVNAIFNDTDFNNIPAVLYEASINAQTKGDFQFFLGKSFSLTPTSAYSPITRSVVPMGYPLQGYLTAEDYEEHMRKWSAEDIKPILEHIRESNSHFEFAYRSDMLWLEDVFTQAMKDVLCAVGSICFIFILILFHTRSLWITGFAILSIISSFVCTNLIYRIVLDFRYIGFFHVLTLFIVLGIGADDVFVFFDVWRNTACEKYPSLAHRLSDAYRKSVFSMLFTSITTATAFFASAISPLLATRSFGVFSGLVIIVNYLSVILYFPTVVVLYHVKFEQFKWPCIQFCKKKCKGACTCCSSKNEIQSVSQASLPNNNDYMVTRVSVTPKHAKKVKDPSIVPSSKHIGNGAIPTVSAKLPAIGDGNTPKHEIVNGEIPTHFDYEIKDLDGEKENVGDGSINSPTPAQDMRVKKRKEKSAVVLFFREKYSWFVTHKIIRWVILCVMVGVLIFFSVQASKLEPDNEGLKVLKDSHVYSIAEDHAINSFVVSNADRTFEIYIVWGMLENDMSDCHFSTPKCLGKRQWDGSFNPSTDAAQTAMLTLCHKMKNFTDAQGDKLRIKKDFTSGEWQINCYMEHLDNYLQNQTTYSTPFTYADASAFMTSQSTYYDVALFNSSYTDHLEIAISHWLSNGHDYSNLPTDFYLFDHLIGEEEGTYTQTLKTDATKKYGNNIKYVGIQVNTTMKFQTLGYAEGLPVMDSWDDFVSQEMTSMPAEANKAFQTTRWVWHWLVVSKMLAENAIYGIIIGVCLAFPILVIATGNIITGFLATVSMGCSTVCVVGVIPLGGWKLGVLVSLNMCMVVGLTVDYVVHLAEGYTLSLHQDRMSRVRDMLDEMAVSVFFGAITTLGASLFMFLAQLSFFLQFGIFMFSTIGFSLFFAMGLFVTLMGLVGPQGDTGNVLAMCRKLRAKCKKTPVSDEEKPE